MWNCLHLILRPHSNFTSGPSNILCGRRIQFRIAPCFYLPPLVFFSLEQNLTFFLVSQDLDTAEDRRPAVEWNGFQFGFVWGVLVMWRDWCLWQAYRKTDAPFLLIESAVLRWLISLCLITDAVHFDHLRWFLPEFSTANFFVINYTVF